MFMLFVQAVCVQQFGEYFLDPGGEYLAAENGAALAGLLAHALAAVADP